MKINVKRFEYGDSYTISKLYIDGQYQCYVLEDKVREVEGQPVESWKIQGETAIPKGTYTLAMTMSARFGRVLPQLLDVTGFEGIRIHSGNTDKDTEGCLLLGTTWAGGDFVGGSRSALEAFLVKVAPVVSLGTEVLLQIGDSSSDF